MARDQTIEIEALRVLQAWLAEQEPMDSATHARHSNRLAAALQVLLVNTRKLHSDIKRVQEMVTPEERRNFPALDALCKRIE